MNKLLILACCFISACISSPDPDDPNAPAKSDKTGAVVVGMGDSMYAGKCLGADVDAKNMKELLGIYTDNVTWFVDEKATKANIVTALKDAVAKYELVIFYYSGHGGSQKFNNPGPEEVDGMDEFLCLYDTYMMDDDIWAIISKSKGRVFCLFDCCHSQTMFRNPSITFKSNISKLKATKDGSSFKMLCWSGCPDSTYSYGGVDGGIFTNTLRDEMKFTDSYSELWKKISTNKTLLKSEEPQQTNIGWDTSLPVFQ